ncbi:MULTISPECIES: hypothetical protein [unclassified Roseofilum]|nr:MULTISPECIES: hypothetical protein [unclassified Roseofilum]
MNNRFSSNEEILDLLYQLLQDYGKKAQQEAVYSALRCYEGQ